MIKRIGYAVPHLLIIINAMYLTFYVIDIFNNMMNFINNSKTTALLAFYCVLTVVESFIYDSIARRHTNKTALSVISWILRFDALTLAIVLISNSLSKAVYTPLALEPVQILVLVLCIIGTVLSVILIKIQRIQKRTEYRKSIEGAAQ